MAMAVLILASAAGDAPGREPRKLRILGADRPRAFFFRNAEGFAANRKITYERWEACFERLMGIQGKVLDEEVLGRQARNPEFFTRFKKRHPDQLVLLHFNGNARDPRYQTDGFFAGHWVYHNGAKVLADIPAEAGVTEIRVSNATLFRTGVGRYRTSNEDIGLCVLDAAGKPDWSKSEQVQLVSVDAKKRLIRVKRGCYGTQPRGFEAGKAWAAAHVTEGPWGSKNNLMWFYNHSTTCPRDAAGRTCDDVLVADLARRFAKGGQLAAFDGVEFDVLHGSCHGGRPGRRPDCDGDGKGDSGFIGGRNVYGIGVIEFIRKLRKALGEDVLILADGHMGRHQRAFGLLNGIESEGWPDLRDARVEDWSGGMNRHLFWLANGREPHFNYINHKFNSPGDQPGRPKRTPVPHSTVRLVMAAGELTDSAFCFAQPPAKDKRSDLIAIWDELWMGTDKRVGWLGRPVGPAVRLGMRRADTLAGLAAPPKAPLLERMSGKSVRFAIDGQALKVSAAGTGAKELRFRLADVPAGGADLLVAVTARADRWAGYPKEMARQMWVGLAAVGGPLVTAEMPETGCRVRGKAAGVLDPASGASVRYFPTRKLGGQARAAYQVHPPWKGGAGGTFWRRTVRVPARASLELHTGMGEKSPAKSDGVVFSVTVGEVGGKARTLLEHTQTASRWERHRLSLAPWAGKTVVLTFTSDCGPKDNSTTDHSFWGDVRIVVPGAPAGGKPERFMTFANAKAFTSHFAFGRVASKTVDLEFRIEGGQAVYISAITAHAAPDVVYRPYERGLVLANPSLRPFEFDLSTLLPGLTYRRLRGSANQDPETNNGAAVGAKVTLGAKDALFLVRTGAGGAPAR